MAEIAKSGDDVVTLLRKLVTNQSGTKVPLSGDGERDLYFKLLQNQSSEIDAGGGSWTTP